MGLPFLFQEVSSADSPFRFTTLVLRLSKESQTKPRGIASWANSPTTLCVLTAPVWLSIRHGHTVLCVLTVLYRLGIMAMPKCVSSQSPGLVDHHGYAEIGVLMVPCSDLSLWPQNPLTQGTTVIPRLSSHLVGHHWAELGPTSIPPPQFQPAHPSTRMLLKPEMEVTV